MMLCLYLAAGFGYSLADLPVMVAAAKFRGHHGLMQLIVVGLLVVVALLFWPVLALAELCRMGAQA